MSYLHFFGVFHPCNTVSIHSSFIQFILFLNTHDLTHILSCLFFLFLTMIDFLSILFVLLHFCSIVFPVTAPFSPAENLGRYVVLLLFYFISSTRKLHSSRVFTACRISAGIFRIS